MHGSAGSLQCSRMSTLKGRCAVVRHSRTAYLGAAGIADAYWEYRLKPWDMAAGVLVLEEAGGSVTTMDGRAFSVFERSVLVSNGFLHDKLLAQTEPATARLLDQGIDLSMWFVPKGYRVHAGAQLE